MCYGEIAHLDIITNSMTNMSWKNIVVFQTYVTILGN